MKFKKDSLYLWNLCLFIGSIFLAAIGIFKIIRNISEGNPAYDHVAIVSIILGLNIGTASFIWMSMPVTGLMETSEQRKQVQKRAYMHF